MKLFHFNTCSLKGLLWTGSGQRLRIIVKLHISNISRHIDEEKEGKRDRVLRALQFLYLKIPPTLKELMDVDCIEHSSNWII